MATLRPLCLMIFACLTSCRAVPAEDPDQRPGARAGEASSSRALTASVLPAAGPAPSGDALSAAERVALLRALDDEHRAWATYDQVLRDFGPRRPFSRIRDAEARHAAALLSLCDRYGVEAPPNRWPGRVERYATWEEACAAAVDAEVANVALYDELLASTGRPDLLAVYDRLRRASLERHLPAFRRSTRGGGRGRSSGT